jgi:hypothetical protein
VFFFGLLVKGVLVLVAGAGLAVVGMAWWAWRTEADLQ